jgi:hypothetical protein
MAVKRQWKRWTPEQAREVLVRWQASGLTLTAFAAQEDVGLGKLMRWKANLGFVGSAPQQVPTPAQAFVPITLRARNVPTEPEPPSSGRLVIRLPDGTRIWLTGLRPDELCQAMLTAVRGSGSAC